MTDYTPPGNEQYQTDIGLGVRLKFIREQNGLSQRELAKRAGVPHSSISMIEQGQNSPSINSLAKILSGIPMSLAHFFSCDLALARQHVYRQSQLVAQQKMLSKGVVLQTIPLAILASNTAFSRIAYAAKAHSGETPLRLNSACSGYVIEGELEVTVNAEVSTLTVGDAFSVAALQPHRLRNPSSTQTCIILICTTD